MLLKVIFYIDNILINQMIKKYDYFDLIIIDAFVWRAINFN